MDETKEIQEFKKYQSHSLDLTDTLKYVMHL